MNHAYCTTTIHKIDHKSCPSLQHFVDGWPTDTNPYPRQLTPLNRNVVSRQPEKDQQPENQFQKAVNLKKQKYLFTNKQQKFFCPYPRIPDIFMMTVVLPAGLTHPPRI